MAANHTPLVMMATQGLMDDSALAVNADMLAALAAYTSQPFIVNFKATVDIFQADVSSLGGITQSSVDSFLHSFDDTAPGLSNVIPLAADISSTYFSDFLTNHINNLFPGSNGVFATRLQSASGYAEQMNSVVNSAVNGQALGASTFQDMDALSTGNISLVNTNTKTFGEELQASGDLFDFANVDIINTPQGLAESLVRINSLVAIAEQLEEQGLDAFELQEALEANPDLEMKPLAQKRLYDAYLNVKDEQLEEILLVMEFEGKSFVKFDSTFKISESFKKQIAPASTSSITTLADLLDLRKVFPNSYSTMQVVSEGKCLLMFTGEAISDCVQALESNLEQSFPADQAKAAQAFGSALQQIKAVHESDPRKLGEQAAGIEKNEGLDSITSLTEPMPADTISFMQEIAGGGSGPDGTFFVTDLIGTPAGIPHTENLTTFNTTLTTLSMTGIEEIMQVMVDVVNGVYDVEADPLEIEDIDIDDFLDYFEPAEVEIPAPLPANGHYTNKRLAIASLQTDLDNAIDDLNNTNPDEIESINEAFDNSINHILLELEKLGEAMIYFDTTYTQFDAILVTSLDAPPIQPVSKQQILGFAGTLPSLGLKTDKGNVAEILEKLATTERGGESMVGSMREGRNAEKFSKAGIQADNKIDDAPKIVIPGNIS